MSEACPRSCRAASVKRPENCPAASGQSLGSVPRRDDDCTHCSHNLREGLSSSLVAERPESFPVQFPGGIWKVSARLRWQWRLDLSTHAAKVARRGGESGQEQHRDLNCDEKWFKVAFKCHPSGRDFFERSLCWTTQGTKRRQRKRVRQRCSRWIIVPAHGNNRAVEAGNPGLGAGRARSRSPAPRSDKGFSTRRQDKAVSISLPRPGRCLSAPFRKSEDREGRLCAGLRQ